MGLQLPAFRRSDAHTTATTTRLARLSLGWPAARQLSFHRHASYAQPHLTNERKEFMARKVQTIITSDLSGKQVREDKSVVMRIEFADGRKNPYVLDISEDEAQEFVEKGTEVKKRGRRPGSKNKPKTAA